MGTKFLQFFSIICILSLVLTNHIELPLYKNPLPKDEKMIDYIDGLEKSDFMTNLSLGTPAQSFPFQVEMTTKDICIVNNKFEPKRTTPALGDDKSKTYKRADTNLQTDVVTLEKSSFDLEMQDYGKIYGGNLNDYSSGILGLSLDSDWLNPKQTKDHKFVKQLVKNKVVSNSVFYFQFNDEKDEEEAKKNPTKVKTVKEYLSTKGKLIIGDYPTGDKSKIKTAGIQQVIKSDSLVMNDDTSEAILFDMNKCIGCQSCVRNCQKIAGQNVLKAVQTDPNNKKKKIVQTVSDKPLVETNCISCGQCSLGCPKGAIKEKDSIKEVSETLKNKNGKVVVCQFAPAIRVNMAEALGVAPGTISTGKLVTALKMLGFDYIFDTNYSADMTIVEEATELLHRLNDPNAVLPMFTSCCPAWINYVEKVQPELIPHLSSCKSPLSMLSSVIKNVFPKKVGLDKSAIYNVAIMPCTAKKDEIVRPQLDGDTDAVVTSRELANMIKAAKIDFKSLQETELDSIYSEYTGGGAIFCATGGVMEAAVRSAYKFITGKDMQPIQLTDVRGSKEGIKRASVDINGIKVNVAVAHGISNAMEIMRKIKNKEDGFETIHFVEVMACPGGCASGGGSPRPKGKKGIDIRIDATYKIDEQSDKRTSQDNEQLNQLYKESFDGEYGSHYAHELLHTYYTNRQVDKAWGINFKQIQFNHTAVTSFYSKGFMKVEKNYIVAPNSFLPVLNREFLNLPEIKEKCKLLTSNKYQVVLCDKDFDVNKFPELDLYSDELDYTFVLQGEDLFVYDSTYDHLLLLVVIDLDPNNESKWDLGLPLLKKESLFFDMEKEEIGVFAKEKPKSVSTSFIININLLAAVIVLSSILIYITVKPTHKGRKKRVNELIEEDGYVE